MTPASEAHNHPIDAERVAHARRAGSPVAGRRRPPDEPAVADGRSGEAPRLLYALDVAEELCVGDLALALDVNEDQTSYALKLLRASGLVHTRKQGRVVFNRLAPDFPAPLKEHCLRQLVAMSHAEDPAEV